MARLPALVAALAAEDDRDPSTLNVIARTVREAGHMATTKRGVGAAGMTVRDAANLLMGTHGADSPKDASAAVPVFRTLRASAMNRAGRGQRDGILGRLDAADSFGEALEILIEGAPELAAMFMQYVDDAYSNLPAETRAEMAFGLLGIVELTVTLHRPNPYATIEISRSPVGRREVDHDWRFEVDANLLLQGHYHMHDTERRVAVSFGFRTLLKLSAALQGGEHP